jgi:hypothetical protein
MLNKYCSPSNAGAIRSRNMRWAGHIKHMRLVNAYVCTFSKSAEDRKSLGITGHRGCDNIKNEPKRWRILVKVVVRFVVP